MTSNLHPVMAEALAPFVQPRKLNDDEATQKEVSEYIALLSRADWSYEFSDDGDVRKRGAETMRRMRVLQQSLDPKHFIWNAFAPHQCASGRSYS